MEKQRRTVNLHPRTNGHGTLWAYGFEDLAHLFRVSVRTVQRWIKQGELDPGDLQSITDFRQRRRVKKTLFRIFRDEPYREPEV